MTPIAYSLDQDVYCRACDPSHEEGVNPDEVHAFFYDDSATGDIHCGTECAKCGDFWKKCSQEWETKMNIEKLISDTVKEYFEHAVAQEDFNRNDMEQWVDENFAWSSSVSELEADDLISLAEDGMELTTDISGSVRDTLKTMAAWGATSRVRAAISEVFDDSNGEISFGMSFKSSHGLGEFIEFEWFSDDHVAGFDGDGDEVCFQRIDIEFNGIVIEKIWIESDTDYIEEAPPEAQIAFAAMRLKHEEGDRPATDG